MAGPARRINQQVAHPLVPGKSDDLDDLACRLCEVAVTRQPITTVTLHNFKMLWSFHIFCAADLLLSAELSRKRGATTTRMAGNSGHQ